MSFFSSRRWAMKEMLKGLSRDKGIFSLAVVLSALALSIPLFISAIFYEIAEPVKQLPTAVEITVFTKHRANTTRIANAIREFEGISDVYEIPKEEALASLNDQLGLKENAEKQHNPLPDIVVATVNPKVSKAGIDAIAQKIEEIRGVDMLAYETVWQEKLRALSKATQIAIISLGIVVLLLVVLVLATSIRITTLSARTQMRSLYIFGASPSFAIRPWAWRGFLLMFIASLSAIGIANGGISILSPAIADIANLYGIELSLSRLNASWCIGFVIICSLIGYIVAVLASQDSWRRVRY